MGEIDDTLLGNLSDGGSPRRGFLHHVVAGAHDVGVVGAVGRSALGQGLLVITNAIGVQEVHIHQVAGDELMGNASHERRVGTGADGNPLHVAVRGDLAAARVDADDAHVLLLHGHQQIVAVAITGHAGVAGGVAEHHHELAVDQRLEGALAPTTAIGVQLGAEGQRPVGVVAVASDHAAAQVEQTEPGVVHDHVLLDAGALLDKDGLVAVSLGDALELGGDGIQSLVPADLLVLALAALGALHALHGIVQAILAVDPAADGTAAQASASLETTEGSVAGIVRFHVGDLVVNHMALQHASAAAVHMAMRPADLLVDRRGVAGFGELGVSGAGALRRAAEQRRGAYGGGPKAGQCGSLHERAARQSGLLGVRHGTLPFLLRISSLLRPAPLP